MVAAREKLHNLVDQLPDDKVEAAERLLQYLEAGEDPVLQAILNAPYDDELETEDERAAVEEGKADLAAGRATSLEDLSRQLGL